MEAPVHLGQKDCASSRPPLTLALLSALATPLPALAASLLYEETRDDGSGVGEIAPEGSALLFPDCVQVKITGADRRTVFRDTFDFSSVLPAGIGRLELTLDFQNAGPVAATVLIAQWSLVVDATPRDPAFFGPLETRRYQSTANDVQDANSPQTFVLTPAIDGTGLFADSDAFAHSATTGECTFWLFDGAGSNPDTMDLYSATLRVYEGDMTPIPLPAGAWLVQAGLGALAVRRRG